MRTNGTKDNTALTHTYKALKDQRLILARAQSTKAASGPWDWPLTQTEYQPR